MTYRADIDGLRALAVLPVVLFHAGFTQFSGGFVGVDVFFVISGYLITRIIADEVSENRFSVLTFYERRARRILPALFTVILFCWVGSLFWMRPDQLQAFADSAKAAVLFFANFYFWSDENAYFAAASEERLLLHTWSLSVEEQFYILFPFLFVVLWRRGAHVAFFSVAAITAASFLFAEWALRQPWISPSTSFYLLPTRAWELLCGALCAIHHKRFGEKSRELWAAFGLTAILASVVVFDHSTPSPSAYLLLPVVGTSFILLFANGTITGAILSWKPLVGIGLISYSVYLWHQPLFAFARIRLVDEPSTALMLGLSLLSLVFGWLSWKFVEKPFRKKGSGGISGPMLARLAVFSAAGLVALSSVTLLHKGFPERLAHYIAWQDEIDSYRFRIGSECHFVDTFDKTEVDSCLQGGTKKVLLVGDSHAANLSAALQLRMQDADMTASSLVSYNCFPVPGLVREGMHTNLDCETFQENVWEYVENRDDLTVVFFVRWALYIEGTRFDNFEGGVERSPEGRYVFSGSMNGDTEASEVLHYTRDFLKTQDSKNEIVLISQFPEAGWDIRSWVTHQPDVVETGLSTPVMAYKLRNQRVDAMLDDLDAAGLGVVRLNEVFCDSFIQNRCAIIWNGTSFFTDDNHPSAYATVKIADRTALQIETN